MPPANRRTVSASALVAAFAAVVCAVPAIEIAQGNWPGRGHRLDVTDLLDGITQRAVDREIEARSAVAPLLRPYYNEALLRLLGAATPQVVLGRDGELFFGPAVVDYPKPAARAELPGIAANAAAVARWFEARGTRFLLALIPDKATVAPDRVPPLKPPYRPYYEQTLAALRATGLTVVDLLPPLCELPEPAFFRSDTHWTSAGARAAARAIAAALAPAFAVAPPGRAVDAELATSAELTKPGDLLRMLGLREDGALHRSYVESYRVTYGVERGSRRQLGSAGPEPLVLAGTSYSFAFLLASLVSAELGREFESVAFQGRGGAFALTSICEELLAGARPQPVVLVWELPERMLLASAEQVQLRRGLENLAPLLEWSDARAAPLAVAARRAIGMEAVAESADGIAGMVHAVGSGVEFVFAEPLPGDGSAALAFKLQAHAAGECRVYFDAGADLDWERPFRCNVVGLDHAQLVVAPVRTAGAAPVRRCFIQPLQERARARVSNLEMWIR